MRGPRGEIVEIIERQTHRFVGTYFEYRGAGQVQVDGPLFTKPVSVGGSTHTAYIAQLLERVQRGEEENARRYLRGG